jgi:hypothetical protein
MGISGDISVGDCSNIINEAFEVDLASKIMANCLTDDLGRGTVFYFPNVKFDFEPRPSY